MDMSDAIRSFIEANDVAFKTKGQRHYWMHTHAESRVQQYSWEGFVIKEGAPWTI